jgi:hypothetical protein
MATSPYSLSDTGGVLTKNDIILGAYSQLRISGITRQPTPEDLEIALERLEDMAAQFNVTMPIGFNFEDLPDPNSDSGVPRALGQCFKANLAMRLIPDFNKEVSPVLIAQANQGLSRMASQSAMQRLQHVQYPNRQAIGSGNYRWARWSRFYRASGNLPTNSANRSLFIGDIDDFIEHFDAYLKDGEDIASYSIVADAGLTISNDVNATPDITYTVQAGTPADSDSTNILQITIIATTTFGRVETRRLFVEVVPRT